jgi:hypothetical protein
MKAARSESPVAGAFAGLPYLLPTMTPLRDFRPSGSPPGLVQGLESAVTERPISHRSPAAFVLQLCNRLIGPGPLRSARLTVP